MVFFANSSYIHVGERIAPSPALVLVFTTTPFQKHSVKFARISCHCCVQFLLTDQLIPDCKLSNMSLRFYGWEATKDDELRASQRPLNRQVYTMYHGTSVASARSIIANGFWQSTRGMLGRGVYVSRNKKKAELYPYGGSDADRVIFELRVSVGRVKRIDKDNHELQFSWHDEHYDTAWVPPNCGMKSAPKGLEEDCVYDPKNVEVVGIAQAPTKALYEELLKLLADRPRSNVAGGGGAAAANLCPLCKKPYGPPHVVGQCWGCGKNICAFMGKHFCPVSG